MKLSEFAKLYGDIEITPEIQEDILLKLNVKPRWIPAFGEKYYYITSYKGIYSSEYSGSSALCYNRWETDNVFKTEEEAKFRLEQINVYNELKLFSENNCSIIDWKNSKTENRNKFYLWYNYEQNELHIGSSSVSRNIGQIYFSNYDLAEKALIEVGEDRIKKYLFGVE